LIAATHLSTDITDALAILPFAIAAFIIVFGVLRSLLAGRRAAPAMLPYLTLGLEFFLAAGLIRLAGADDFATLGVVAAIILARRVISFGIRYGARAAG
jgi:uncharacterized membrane protein